MDTKHVYRNASLEARRRQELARQRADEALRASKQGKLSPEKQIEAGFGGSRPRDGLPLAGWIVRIRMPRDAAYDEAFRALLSAAAAHRSPMLDEERYVRALARLARWRPSWLRAPGAWKPRAYAAARQFSSLARHLLARYDVPALFDQAWLHAGHDAGAARGWFAHLGAGRNLRTAEHLPFPLTKMMAHHALRAPAELSVLQALRWGQVMGLGGVQRLARAVVASRLRDRLPDEPFWLTVVQFLARHPMLDPHQVGPLVDYLFAQRFEREPARVVGGTVIGGTIPQPNLSRKGRTLDSLLRQVRAWHAQLGRRRAGARELVWPPSGIAGLHRVEGEPGNQRLFLVTELLCSRELVAEGSAMRHCVATYAHSCEQGRSAIFSLRVDAGAGLERRLTIDVNVKARTIVEARGRFNAPAQPLDERILRAWAVQARLTIAPYALGTRWG